MPSSDKNVYVDVDFGGTNPISGNSRNRDACFRVSFVDPTGEGEGNTNTLDVTVNSVSNITTTADANYITGVSDFTTNKHSGIVPNGQTTLVAHYTVTANSSGTNYHLNPLPSGNGVDAIWNALPSNSAYQNYYTFNITNNYYTAAANATFIQSCDIRIYYTPPVGVTGLDPDPSDMCALLHDIRLDHDAQVIPASANQMTQVHTMGNVFVGGTQALGVIANAAGYGKVGVQKLNAAGNAASGSYNFSTGAWDFGDATHTKELQWTTAYTQLNEYFDMSTDASNAPGTYSVVLSAGTTSPTLSVASTAPDAINEHNFTCLQNTSTTNITTGTKTNLSGSGSVSIAANFEKTKVDNNYTLTSTFTKTGGTTLTLDPRNITLDDFTGGAMEFPLKNDTSAGATTIPLNDTTGLKVGMVVTDSIVSTPSSAGTSNVFAEDTKITTVNSEGDNKSIVIDKATLADFDQDEKFRVVSDWKYELVSATAVQGDANTVTVTSVIKLKQYGMKTPNGDLVLQPNFITIS
jgi:hypothetical protein